MAHVIPQGPQGPQAQYVVLPQQSQSRSALGIVGLLTALIGLFIPTGIIAVLGLIISLVAVGRGPRVAATMGILIGLVGTAVWLVIDIFAVIGIVLVMVAAVVGSAVAFTVTQPEVIEVTSDMTNVVVAAKDHEQRHGSFDSIDDLDLEKAITIDPWGTNYRVVAIADDPGVDVISAGPDGLFESDDDIALSSLDEYWEDALENMDSKWELFGERLASFDDGRFTCDAIACDVSASTCCSESPACEPAPTSVVDATPPTLRERYEEEARAQIVEPESD